MIQVKRNIIDTNPQEIINDLREKFYVDIPFPIERGVIEKAVQAFFEFLNQPDQVKNHIDFTIAPQHRRGDVGYKRRDAENHVYDDNKDFFHYHPALFERHTDFLEENPVVKDFVMQAAPIWDMANKALQDIFNSLEPDFPGIYNKIFDTEHSHILLRFLRYDWENSGKYLAKPHYDAGSFTLAIAESCIGLRIGSGPENLKIVEHKVENAILMLASNFQKVIDADGLKAGWHDVIQLDEVQIGKPFSRWAVVVFIDAHSVESLPRTETHKWYTAE